jgi:hypothetical protein
LGMTHPPFLLLRTPADQLILVELLPQCGWHRDSCDVSDCGPCDISGFSSETFSQGSWNYTNPSSANHTSTSILFFFNFIQTERIFRGHFLLLHHTLFTAPPPPLAHFLSSAPIFTSSSIRKFRNE